MADSTAADRSPQIVPDSCGRGARSRWQTIAAWTVCALLAAAAAAVLAAVLAAFLPRRRRGTRRLRRSRPWHRTRTARARSRARGREDEPPA